MEGLVIGDFSEKESPETYMRMTIKAAPAK
jgi:hypothetical protein